MTHNRTVRIFLSSTFFDFGDERRLLVQEVFPELRARLRQRFVDLVDVDLRWGISAEEAEQGRVLSICLEEIDQCRPYFIAMLGERYGWVPPADRYDPALVEQRPWLGEHQGSASVTELEIMHAVLNDPAMAGHAFFYFRDPAYAHRLAGDYVSSSPEDAARLALLKDRIRASGFPVVEDYPDTEALAERLKADLWAHLDVEFPAEKVPDFHELENLSHATFAASKLGSRFVADPPLNMRLSDLVAEGHQCILVTGPAGIGKSTLLANWMQNDVPPATRVLHHFFEANENSANVIDFAQRLFELIRRETGCDAQIPEDRNGILRGLPEWLAIAHAHAERTKQSWIIVLDGLDRLVTGRDLMWLPPFIPKSIRFIVSCRPGAVRSALKRRGKWNSLELTPMEPERRESLLRGQLIAFKKQLNEKQISTIVGHSRADQPLFLCTLAEELRIFGSFEGLPVHIDSLLSSAEIGDLYKEILLRLEANHGVQGVRLALSALCLSDGGLTEDEILEFSGLSYQARWSPIRLALGDALSNMSGRIRPSHGHIRQAVRERYYTDLETKQALHKELAQWFGGQPFNRRAAKEQAAQLWMASDYNALLDLLSDRTIFDLVSQMGGKLRLQRYWHDIEAALGVTPLDHYKGIWGQWRAEMSFNQRMSISARLQSFLRYCGAVDDFLLQLSLDYLQDCRTAYGDSDIRYLQQMGNCAETMAAHRDYLERARLLAEQACSETERLADGKQAALGAQFLILAKICSKQRDYQPAIASARRSLMLQEAAENPDHPSVVPHLNCLTDILLAKAGGIRKDKDGQIVGSYQLGEAIDLQARCLRILKGSRGLIHLDAAACMVRTGRVFSRCGKPEHALRAYTQAIETFTRLVGERHPLTRSARRGLNALSSRSAKTEAAELGATS